jgi:anti-sigma-K factor RskA
MFEDDQETLAAEYVLGTLSGEEREHAEALRSFDPEFDAAVKQWERRLGELNVMVEAVEPPAEVWEKIKTEIGVETPAADEAVDADDVEHAAQPESAEAVDAADFLFVEAGATQPDETAGQDVASVADEIAELMPATARAGGERAADIIRLRRRVGRWRGSAIALAAIAAVLAAYIAVSQVAPDLIPPRLRDAGANLMAHTAPPPERGPTDRLVAVLQQQPIAPAFLLTVDTQQRTVVVRRVSAGLENGRSYELWLIAGRATPPKSLGVVGSDEFTERPLPVNVDIDALRAATFAVSLEPAGGSPTGAPTGPVLFTGKAVDSLPAQPAPTPRT